MKTLCICGGGSLGHVISGFISAKTDLKVNVLTNKPNLWGRKIDVNTPDGLVLHGCLNKVSSNPADVIPMSDIVLLCVPGFMIKEELLKIEPYLNKNIYVGSVFSSTGFFFEAKSFLSKDIPLWGFQRVPFISRVKEYGKSAYLLGYKDSYNIAVENVSDKEKETFRSFVETVFERPTHLLSNYLEASLTNSNPILHTSRLYSMFGDWNPKIRYPRNILFYEEWTEYSSEVLIKMDEEFFSLLGKLPVSHGYLPSILDYYESHDSKTLANKLSSIKGFKGIYSPMKEIEGGWIPDFESRYFTEDFLFGLKYIWQLAQEHDVNTPTIDAVYNWGVDMIRSNS